MNLLKSLKERKAITIFFIICFTVGILIFSVGNSAIVSQENQVKEFNPENNKIITFMNYENLLVKDLGKVLDNKDITISVLRAYFEKATGVETYILPKDKELPVDMKSGNKLTSEDLKGSSNNMICSSRLDDNFQLSDLDEKIEVKANKVGSYYDMDRKLIIPNKLFMDLYGNLDVNSGFIQIIFRGEPSKINEAVKEIEVDLKSKNIKDGLIVSPVELVDRKAEGKALYSAAIMIFIITIINSVSISSLWVESRKKEIVLRKVFGAKNADVCKIFFGELALIAIISLIFTIVIQYILSMITGGFISNIDLRLNIKTIMTSFMISIVTALAISLPSLRYISKIQPAEMLKEE